MHRAGDCSGANSLCVCLFFRRPNFYDSYSPNRFSPTHSRGPP
jgi:hypothetical protein